ncbi:outer membrane protein assembly factor BamD [candidate division WOR-3 bacterium]|nr:outer membrane protein assembly factor BamD [candidate division WOR-3 bacterium]MCK4528675.1 outer membrane protein assembly factor BamD [candidate division WOR-3 bacterium]
MALFLLTCTHNVKLPLLEAAEEYQRAHQYFESGNYGKSLELFRAFFNNHPGSELVDDAQFYYAESFYKIGNYQEALQEFQFLVVNFPNSEYSEKSLLRKAQCLEEMSPLIQRDQEITKKALEIYEEFGLRYPYSKYLDESKEGIERMREKLNKKLLEIAEIYIKMGKSKAAKIYLVGVLKRSDKWDDKAYLLLGDIASKEGQDSLALFYYGKVGGEFESEAKKRLDKIQ